jgi:hypothetical protein
MKMVGRYATIVIGKMYPFMKNALSVTRLGLSQSVMKMADPSALIVVGRTHPYTKPVLYVGKFAQ